jgi:4-alpha-glucanotransferase
MNVPGVPEGNWRFRTTAETVNSADLPYFCRLNKIFRR